MMSANGDCADKTLKLYVKKINLTVLYGLFQDGVYVRTELGNTVRDTLKSVFNISDEFIERKISTILIDGKVVDDINHTRIRENSTLALSGAMPGLAGATMRVKSIYGPLRRSITYGESNDNYTVKSGLLNIKIFNILIGELAPILLKQGIILYVERLKNLLLMIKDDIINAYTDKKEINPSEIIKILGRCDDKKVILTKINFMN